MQDVFEVGRRFRIMNPDRMRSSYGMLMHMLMDSAEATIQELLEFKCVRPLRTVYSRLGAPNPPISTLPRYPPRNQKLYRKKGESHSFTESIACRVTYHERVMVYQVQQHAQKGIRQANNSPELANLSRDFAYECTRESNKMPYSQ